MVQIPITGARGLLTTEVATIYSVPVAKETVFVTIENISFTNAIDDDAFEITLYQNSEGGEEVPSILWSFKFTALAKTVVDADIKKLLKGDTLLAVCNKETVEYVINGYYEKAL